MSCQEVQLKWSFLTTDMENNVASLIYCTIVDIFVDIRGFAFASGCIEMYKRSQKSTLEKKTSLRKELS